MRRKKISRRTGAEVRRGTDGGYRGRDKGPWNGDGKQLLVRERDREGKTEKRQISAAPQLRGLRSLALLPITKDFSSRNPPTLSH